MSAGATLSELFEPQAAACERLGSPFTGRLCRLLSELLDRASQTGSRALSWPGNPRADALALRLCGALHALVLAGTDAGLATVYPPRQASAEELRAAVAGAIARHDGFIRGFLDSAPQTNEIARSAMLLPGLLAIARETGLPLDLAEIGASAGLNLNLDRFHYRYGTVEWGDESSPVRLAPETLGAPPPLEGELTVARRAGCDLAPIDIEDPAQVLRLKSYLWADQPHRLERLEAAIAVARAAPYALERADAAEFVKWRLAARAGGTAFVLFHSIMWQYLPEAAKGAISGAMSEAGRAATTQAPLAWLTMEPVADAGAEGHALLSLTMWPGGVTRQLARADFHGRWIKWVAD